ncbi:GntR family transcriptional regulator [Paenibacillus protaetiae]|uniref:GntR family transcriptional regulator n=1 Tax=Paenibacillus protaetiae TaxID=2509456 RepID=A0A4P6EW57_9BACL|nr:GntR family transcriptional regulator [Paenibacillus protaetiae]QAY67560.1 GntR family transcriptional regulator [Paenibacillus protaetiae]
MMEKKLLYIRIKEEIERRIQAGEIKPGERLPSEPALAKEFEVSRPTLRESLKMLQREGTLISKNGVGTYVNERSSSIVNPLNKLRSLGDMIKSVGYKDSEADVKVYSQEAETEWAEKLQTSGPVVILERVRTADEMKVAFYYNIIPMEIAADHFTEGFSGAIFDFLRERLGITVSYAITEICAVGAGGARDRRAAEVLGEGLLLLKQLHFDENDRPVFYSLDYLKSSSFQLFVRRD